MSSLFLSDACLGCWLPCSMGWAYISEKRDGCESNFHDPANRFDRMFGGLQYSELFHYLCYLTHKNSINRTVLKVAKVGPGTPLLIFFLFFRYFFLIGHLCLLILLFKWFDNGIWPMETCLMGFVLQYRPAVSVSWIEMFETQAIN